MTPLRPPLRLQKSKSISKKSIVLTYQSIKDFFFIRINALLLKSFFSETKDKNKKYYNDD